MTDPSHQDQPTAGGPPPGSNRRRVTLSVRLAILIAVLLASSAVITTLFSVRSVQSRMYAESEQSVTNIHTSINALIAIEYANVQAFRTASLERRKAELKDVAAPIATALDSLRAEAASGQITEAQAKQDALAMLKAIRFGNNDYFFTYNRDLVAIAHPDPKFQGKNLTDFKDADGKYVLQEIRDVALKQGSGYVDYRWVRLNEDKPSPKIGYVFHYAPWDWIIGTGVYVDDIDADAAARLESTKTTLAATFDNVSFRDSGFFFILDKYGKVVVAPKSHDVSGLTSTTQGSNNAQAIVDAAPTKDGEVTTLTTDVALPDGTAEPMVLNVSTFTPLGWILVSAVPQAELEGPGRTLALQQALLAIVVLIIGLASGLLLSRRIVRPVMEITNAAQDLEQDRFDPASLDKAAQRHDEVGNLARTFQRMGTEIVQRERKLREQVAKLTVEIDRSKVEAAVADITESEYFQRIREQAAEMRKRAKGEETDA